MHNYIILKQVLKAYHKRSKLSNKAVFTHKKGPCGKEIMETHRDPYWLVDPEADSGYTIIAELPTLYLNTLPCICGGTNINIT